MDRAHGASNQSDAGVTLHQPENGHDARRAKSKGSQSCGRDDGVRKSETGDRPNLSAKSDPRGYGIPRTRSRARESDNHCGITPRLKSSRSLTTAILYQLRRKPYAFSQLP